MRKVILSAAIRERLGDLESFLRTEYKLSKEAASRRMDRIGGSLKSLLTASTADGALACLENSPFNLCKSNVKFREYGARGLAGIYSNIPVYADWVEHDRTGLLVENTETAWYASMAFLVENPETAREIGNNARACAEEKFTLERYAEAWMEQVLDPLAGG